MLEKKRLYIELDSQVENFLYQHYLIYPILRTLAKKKPIFVLAAFVLFTSFAEAGTTRVVNSTSNDSSAIGTLPYWLLNASDGDSIDCSSIAGQSIVLTSSLPAVNYSYTINGAGITIDGNNSFQAFQVASGNVIINDVNIQNALSKGGNGGDGYSGGGGAVGGGGALYIHGGASVTLTASSLLHNTAQGGDGGAADNIGNGGGGGGGGFGGGDGGNCLTVISTGGGGGGHSNGGGGGSASSVNGSNGIYFGGGGGGGGINLAVPGGNGGSAGPAGAFIGGAQSGGNGGGGAGNSEDGFSATDTGSSGVPGNGGNGIGADFLFGGGGGGGCSSETGFTGAEGVGAAGGGGSYNYAGGAGGILGGGGGGGGSSGGEGGFGSGGGGAVIGGAGGGSFDAGGGNGGSDPSANGGGGGGSGLGGAIFIQSGGSLIIVDATQISDNTAIAGVGGTSTGASNPGYIAAGDGAAMGYDIFVREEGSITFNLSNTLTIATPIEGDQTNGPNSSGGLYKLGKGTLKLNGANTYSGMTTINRGVLNLNGSVIGSAFVGAEGILSGNATISGNLTNSGILAPGNSIGIINTTNLILTSSSLLEMEVTSDGTNDLIIATGVAELNGTLKVIPLPGNFQAVQSYTFVTAAGGTTGTFSKIESSLPSLLKVNYSSTSVLVEAIPISDLKLSSNAFAAASCYLSDGFSPGSDIEAVSTALFTLDVDEMNDSFNQMQPSQFSGLAWSQIENTLLIRSSYSQHLEEVNLVASCNKGPHVWGEVIGGWQKQNSEKQQFGYTDWSSGGTVGVDAVCQEKFRFGIAGSYTYSRLNWSRSAGYVNTNSYYGGVYMKWLKGHGYINATLLGAYTHYQTHRHLHFATIDRHAKSSHHGWEGLAGLEGGVNFAWGEHIQITPFIREDYVYLSTQGFVENGASSLNLSVKGSQKQIIQSEVGVSWVGRYVYENSSRSGTFVPRIKLSYINDVPLTSRCLNASFVDSDCNFTVQGLSFKQNLGAVSLGLTHLNSDDTVGVTLRYDGQFGSNFYTQEVNIALDVKF